jgi:hypothetical protein
MMLDGASSNSFNYQSFSLPDCLSHWIIEATGVGVDKLYFSL